MDSFFKTAALAAVAPKILKNFKWQWLLYGAAAYYALKLLNERGVFSTVKADAKTSGQDFVDTTATSIEEKLDLGEYRPSDVAPSTIH